MKINIFIKVALGIISVSFIGCADNIKKGWHDNSDNTNNLLTKTIWLCNGDKGLKDKDFINVINYAYGKDNDITAEKILKIARCTKKSMSKYSPNKLTKSLYDKNDKLIDEYFDYIKEIRSKSN